MCEKCEDPLFGLEAIKRQADQSGVNCRWLVEQIDQIHSALCPRQIGTWQDRARQAVGAARKISSSQCISQNGKDFPIECVRHLAKSNCNCQRSGPDVENNRHVKSCMVGKAQKYLRIKVGDKPLYGGSITN